MSSVVAWSPIYKFPLDPAVSVRLKRWQWWKALANVGIYVHELYAFTNFEHRANAGALGNNGAESIQVTDHPEATGTVTWFTADGRLDSTNGNYKLWSLVHAGFDAWDPATDLGSYAGRQIPKQIVKAFGPQVAHFRRSSCCWQH
jgi:hypothetical protein